MGRIALAAERAGAPSVRSEAVPASAGIDIRIHRAAEAIGALAQDWIRLAAEAAEPNVFAEHWFVAASLRAFSAGRDIRLIEARRAGRLIGLLPVTVERGYAHLPVRFVQNWYHDHAFLGTPLVAAGEERAFWAAALEALGQADWAPGFLHLRGIAEGGPVHRGLAKAAVVHRRLRACLESDLGPQAYFERAVRPKKRKELRRLRNRLAGLGPVRCRALDHPADLDAWCDAYLAMDEAGWKGRAGSALVHDPRTESFFRDVVAAAWAVGRLQFLRLEVGDRTIAMLVNFLTPPGSFSFKTVFDEDYARFSPGVLIQIENLDILARPDIAWMDSCAVEHHPMIDSLWTERRSIVRVTVRLKGGRRFAVFSLCRALELGSAAVRKLVR